MHAVVHRERTVTDLDFARLKRLLSQQFSPTLAELLNNVEITGSRAVSSDLVTMYSRAEVVDVHTRHRQVLTVCYPCDAQPIAGFISVLSPVGSSLLGLKTGDVARWHTPNGDECAAEVVSIQYQPEATGDFTR
jgi:regulator of nucleoside diphosphate kinase